MAAERYLLGEMNKDERARFEEHVFECDACAADVGDGIALLDNGRVYAEAERRFRPRGRVMTWMPTAVAAALAVVVGVQIFAPKKVVNQPVIQVVEFHQLDQSRGAGDKAIPANRPAVVDVLIPPEPSYPSYRCDLRDAAGHSRQAVSVTAAQAKENLFLLLSALPAGSYVVVVEGVREDGNRTEITRYPVNVVQGP